MAPDATDLLEFQGQGGTIAGTVTAGALQFSGNESRDLSGATNFSASTEVTVGQGAAGSLLVKNGASIDGMGASDVIGAATDKAGQVTVDGAGSTWKSAGALNVGDPGAGSLTVSNQGTVETGVNLAAYPAGGIGLGENSGASGEVIVVGTKSLLSNAGRFVVGDIGPGGVSIDAGGTVVTALGPAAPA